MSAASASTMTYARSGSKGAGVHIDPVTVSIVLAIVLLGLVMVASASISVATKESGNAFAYLERQLVLTVIGMSLAALIFCMPLRVLERLSMPLMIGALALLFVVLMPGLGHTVNGSRRWLSLAGLNFQVSELARVLILVYVASYAVRRESELRETFMGLLKPLVLVCFAGLLLLCEPDFGAFSVLFATGFGLLFLAGARLRWVLGMMVCACAAFAALIMIAPYRVTRLAAFRDPWADPFNTGFQLTQSLIAIGRGEWFGVGLGESVQKLFYLPEAHTDFLFAVLGEELGLAGVLLTLGLFLALVWRSFHIARLASDAGLKFQSYIAATFGLWLGIQAFINIGVNMGVLPTKGLTLPLMSYGRSSLIVTLAWLGLLLRVYHEAVVDGRGAATTRRRREPDGEQA